MVATVSVTSFANAISEIQDNTDGIDTFSHLPNGEVDWPVQKPGTGDEIPPFDIEPPEWPPKE